MVELDMRPYIKTPLASLSIFVALAISAVGVVYPTEAIAQERRADDDDERGESGSRRRGDWGSFRRNRSDSDRDETSNRGGESDREPGKRDSDDSPEITPETWAKSLVDKHDKNKNKVLDGDEISALTGPARAADFNKDGFISREELIASLPGPNSKPSAPASKPSTTPTPKPTADQKSTAMSKRVLTWIGGNSGDAGKTTRRTYRFTPARERLPSEVPGWFKTQDKNGDGQVAMSEYSRSWTKSTVARFQAYDANGDGIVTAKEAAGKK
jgi:hypothetical protein